jgi:hypothetical protein
MLAFVGGDPCTPSPGGCRVCAPGVGKVPCFECLGRPKEYVALFDPELGITQCTDCKDLGWVYIGI